MAASPPSSWVGQPHVKGATEFTRMVLLTFSMIGLQFCWGTEMTYATPYLLALGLSKSRLSLVWIAGPLSGLVMQPIIGMLSDKSRHKLGRRRPFMIYGSLAVAVCLLVLGWAVEIVGCFGLDPETRRKATVALAVVDIYILDFVINIAQATCRALVVDTLPVSKQQLGSAWVSRMAGVGHMLIYAVGALDLNAVLGNTLGDTQFKKVCAIAAIAMLIAQGVTCWAVTERVLVSNGSKTPTTDDSLISIVRQIYKAFLECPERIQAVCWIQFWGWIGWFPFLFYGSTWVGRVGSTAMIVYSLVGFLASIFLPSLVESPETFDEKEEYTPRPPAALKSAIAMAKTHRPSLLTAWTMSNLTFAVTMVFAPFVQSVGVATFLMAFCGIPAAVSGLATGTFLGVEVNKLSSALPTARGRPSTRRKSDAPAIEMDNSTSSTGELAGIYFGIFNIYQTVPQFIGTGISWVVFSILEPGKSPELALDAEPSERQKPAGLSGIGVCLFIGALSALNAAWATRRLRNLR